MCRASSWWPPGRRSPTQTKCPKTPEMLHEWFAVKQWCLRPDQPYFHAYFLRNLFTHTHTRTHRRTPIVLTRVSIFVEEFFRDIPSHRNRVRISQNKNGERIKKKQSLWLRIIVEACDDNDTLGNTRCAQINFIVNWISTAQSFSASTVAD